MSTDFTDKVPVSLFLANLESLRGIPYIWAGKDPHGLDCSGCVTFALKQSNGPDLTEFWNCAKLITECTPVQPIDYLPGNLAFYGHSMKTPDHVMAVYPATNGGGLIAYGACGGNHYTTTKELAKKIGACVKERPRIAYRHDFLGVFAWKRLDYTK